MDLDSGCENKQRTGREADKEEAKSWVWGFVGSVVVLYGGRVVVGNELAAVWGWL